MRIVIVVVSVVAVFIIWISRKAHSVSPDSFAEAISNIYADGIRMVVELSSEETPSEEMERLLKEKKEEMIKDLVKLGYIYKDFNSEYKKKADDVVRTLIMRKGESFWDDYISAVQKYYSINSLINDFNLITRYAFFDLLWEDLPSEAERLGLPEYSTYKANRKLPIDLSALGKLNWDLNTELEGTDEGTGSAVRVPKPQPGEEKASVWLSWDIPENDIVSYLIFFPEKEGSENIPLDRFLKITVSDLPASLIKMSPFSEGSSGIIKLVGEKSGGGYVDITGCIVGSERARRRLNLEPVKDGLFGHIKRLP